MNDCTDRIPRNCAEAFTRIESNLARMERLTACVHESVGASTQRLNELADQSIRAREQMARLTAELAAAQSDQRRSDRHVESILSAGWRLAVILASIVASVLGLKNLFSM